MVPDDQETFSYYELNRLTQVISSTTKGYTATYSYDPIGNINTPARTYPGSGQRATGAASALGGGRWSYETDAQAGGRQPAFEPAHAHLDQQGRCSDEDGSRQNFGRVQ